MSRKQRILQWTLYALLVVITLTVAASFPNNFLVTIWEKIWMYFGLGYVCYLIASWLGESDR